MSKEFANNLRYYRSLSNMTQGELANKTQTTRSFQILCALADVLGVDITDLVEEKDLTQEPMRRMLLTENEVFLIDIYRKADPTYAGIAVDILRTHPKEG